MCLNVNVSLPSVQAWNQRGRQLKAIPISIQLEPVAGANTVTIRTAIVSSSIAVEGCMQQATVSCNAFPLHFPAFLRQLFLRVATQLGQFTRAGHDPLSPIASDLLGWEQDMLTAAIGKVRSLEQTRANRYYF